MKKKRRTGITVFVLTAAVILTGCRNMKETGGEAETGNRLVTVTSGEVNTCYPLNTDVQNQIAGPNVYDTLVRYYKGEFEPRLADSWEFNEAGTELTFHLKKGVTYHDGAPFNAESVKKDLLFKKSNPNYGFLVGVVGIQAAEVVDENTIKFIYAAPSPEFLNDFCYMDVMNMVSPNAIEEGNFESMKAVIGTGAYQYSKFKEGEGTVLTRNENYWGEKPQFDEIEIKYIPEASSRLQALKNGEIDLIFGNTLLSWDDYKQAASLPGIKGEVCPFPTRTNNLVLNASHDSMSELKVREAIAYAIDKEAISRGLSDGNEPVADTFYPDGTPYIDNSRAIVRKYDKAKSEQLLEEAGWKFEDGSKVRSKEGKLLSLKMTYDSAQIYNNLLVTTIMSQMAEVGIEVEPTGLDGMTWWKTGLDGDYDITIWNTTSPYRDPQAFYTGMENMTPHVPSIKAVLGSDAFLGNIRRFQTTNDKEELQEIFYELGKWDQENVIDIPITYGKDMIVYNENKIKGYKFLGGPLYFDADALTLNK